MSFALPARQVTFGRSTHVAPQPQPQPPQAAPTYSTNALALPHQPGQNPYALPGPSSLALPGPMPPVPLYPSQPQVSQMQPPSTAPPMANSVTALAGPSTPAPSVVPATPAPLTLEQQHITAVEGIVPTLQNIVATVNLDCRLDLKTIALHARNAEYNPKVGTFHSLL